MLSPRIRDLQEGTFKPRTLLTYTPYLWVSNSPALVGGRTVFGFPKHTACLAMPKPGAPAIFSADPWVTRVCGQRAQKLRLLTIARRDGGAWEEPTHHWADVQQIVDMLGLVFDTIGTV